MTIDVLRNKKINIFLLLRARICTVEKGKYKYGVGKDKKEYQIFSYNCNWSCLWIQIYTHSTYILHIIYTHSHCYICIYVCCLWIYVCLHVCIYICVCVYVHVYASIHSYFCLLKVSRCKEISIAMITAIAQIIVFLGIYPKELKIFVHTKPYKQCL